MIFGAIFGIDVSSFFIDCGMDVRDYLGSCFGRNINEKINGFLIGFLDGSRSDFGSQNTTEMDHKVYLVKP